MNFTCSTVLERDNIHLQHQLERFNCLPIEPLATMAVDEFGREIKITIDRDGSNSPLQEGQDDPALLNDALPTSRYDEGPPVYRNTSSYTDHRSIRKRKHRDDSPGPSNRRSSKSSMPHPSTLYAEVPMRCQYLWEKNKGDEDETYDEYRKAYCLNYIRTFFNQHMDDSWFRAMYSPLEEQRVVLQERARAVQEAKVFSVELENSLSKNSGDSKCFFVLKARLGGGIRHQTKVPANDYHLNQSSLSNPIPGSHVLTMANHVLPIQDVPPHVTDEQIVLALLAHVETLRPDKFQIFSSSVPGFGNLFRTAYIHCTNEVRTEIIQGLNNIDRPMPAVTEAASHVPRKEETHIPKLLPLEVECSDAYGRTEFDADGKGGVGEVEGGVPPLKVTIYVSTVASQLTPHVAVLSAAVSSKVHIAKDRKAAHTLAKAYDIRRNIPEETRFESLLPRVLPGFDPDTASPQDCEDALDLAVAYLRRVHLVSFYNACATAQRVADIFNRNHPASTIYLRLGNADEILPPVATNEPPTEPPKVDMLVQRHDLSIEKALGEAQPWLDEPSKWCQIILSPEKDAEAERISREESEVEPGWVQDHSIVDEDGRARCTFHFCRKLFKDFVFLKKHILKKHSEFLVAERAKCHDQSMMEAWDAQEHRPVPPILVDCGRSFFLVPSPVIGADVPLAEDPEPELWRRETERREMDDKLRKEREARFEPPPDDMDSSRIEDRPIRHSNFVDVDDMKEEKVELAFENVEIPLPSKKKKKKKLL